MSNLLDRSSLVLTPTAFNNGEALCIKPDDGSGDFDFSRNSAATRVNAQGLVENVQILSSNLVQNPSFSEEGVQEISNGSFSQESSELITNGDFATDSDWVHRTSNSVISNGTLSWSGTQTLADDVYQQKIGYVGKLVKMTITISSYTQGSVFLRAGSSQSPTSHSSVGTFTEILEWVGNDYIYVKASSDFIGSIESVSVREVGQDWFLGTGWSIGEDKAERISTGTYTPITQGGILTAGNSYKVTYTVNDGSVGGVRVQLGGTYAGDYNGVGTHTIYGVAGTSDFNNFKLVGEPNFIGSITNISVKEVGMDWTLGTGVSIGSNEAVFTSTPSGQSVGQNAVAAALPNGALSKVSFEVLTRTEGTFGIYFSGTLVGTLASAGVFTGYFTKGTETSFYIRALGTTSGTISNVNVIQITDDTNLPRISYENFSYQDALGSEEVVNGSFDNGGANWSLGSWTAQNNTATINGQSGILSQASPPLVSGKKYKWTFEITEYNSGSVKLYSGAGSDAATYENSVGIHTQYFVANGTGKYFYSNSFNGSITNVSVKEYLGQEVVPNSGCGSWLFEPQSTNLVTYSSDYTQWNKSGSMVITSNNAISPDGTQNADLLTANAANQFIYLSSFSSANSTISLYIKRKTGTGSIELSNNGGASYTALSVTDEWSRVQVTFATSTNQTVIKINTSGDEIYLWGVQVEALSYASSLIPTSGSQVTRNQDVCNNGATGAGLINSTEGVLYWEGAKLQAVPDTQVIGLSDGSGANRISFQTTTTANQIRFVVDAGGQQAGESFIVSDITDYNKFALKWKQDDFSFWINGTKVGTDTSGNVPPLNALDTLDFYYGTGIFNFTAKTKALAVWKEALSDQELADLTYPTPTDPTFTLDFDTIAEQFTFARGSEATYVDAQGLIQSTNEIGEELITNGDFEDGSTDWTLGSSWSVSNGLAYTDGSAQNFISQNIGLVTGKTYNLSFDISNRVGTDGCIVIFGGSTFSGNAFANGTQTFQATANGGIELRIYGFNGNTYNLDNVSVKEVISATNTPRLDYSTGAEAFLLEPQSTNILPYSSDFSQWNLSSNASVNANQTISPDGTQNAYLLNSTQASSRVQVNLGNLTGVYAQSIYLKYAGDDVLVRIRRNQSNDRFDLIVNSDGITTGTVDSGVIEYSIEAVGNDWYRVWNTQNNLTWYQLYIDASGNGGSIYAYGAQLEALPYASSLIPTNGSQTTRNQETCINATPEINSEEGVLYFEASRLSDLGTCQIGLFGSSVNEQLRIEFNNSSIRAQLYNGSYQVNMTSSQTVTNNNKIAFKYKENDFALWINGVEVLTDNSGVTFNADELIKFNLSGADGSANPFFGNTKDVQVYTKALSDAELIKLTTI